MRFLSASKTENKCIQNACAPIVRTSRSGSRHCQHGHSQSVIFEITKNTLTTPLAKASLHNLEKFLQDYTNSQNTQFPTEPKKTVLLASPCLPDSDLLTSISFWGVSRNSEWRFSSRTHARNQESSENSLWRLNWYWVLRKHGPLASGFPPPSGSKLWFKTFSLQVNSLSLAGVAFFSD